MSVQIDTTDTRLSIRHGSLPLLLMAWALAAFAARVVVSMIAEWREMDAAMRLLYPIFITMPIVGIAWVAVYGFAKRLIVADRETRKLRITRLLWPIYPTKQISFNEVRAIIPEDTASHGLRFYHARIQLMNYGSVDLFATFDANERDQMVAALGAFLNIAPARVTTGHSAPNTVQQAGDSSGDGGK